MTPAGWALRSSTYGLARMDSRTHARLDSDRMSDIRLKRTYDNAAANDGQRILVDGMWPRGVKKEDAAIDHWLKQLAPSSELRECCENGRVTLVFAARDQQYNNAVVLKALLQEG